MAGARAAQSPRRRTDGVRICAGHVRAAYAGDVSRARHGASLQGNGRWLWHFHDNTYEGKNLTAWTFLTVCCNTHRPGLI